MRTLTLTAEFENAVKKDVDAINTLIVEFTGDLKRVAPVDTGEFKDSWKMTRPQKLFWTIENKQEYASILWAGRRMGRSKLGNPKKYGSLQWAEGGQPMLIRFKRKLNKVSQ